MHLKQYLAYINVCYHGDDFDDNDGSPLQNIRKRKLKKKKLKYNTYTEK